jgi:hypothetical protein
MSLETRLNKLFERVIPSSAYFFEVGCETTGRHEYIRASTVFLELLHAMRKVPIDI